MLLEQLIRAENEELKDQVERLELLIIEMQKTIDTFEKDSIFLTALIEVGVDNWDGYSEAQELVELWKSDLT